MEETKVLLDDSMFEKLDDSEKNTEFIAMESKTYLQDAWRCFKKNKLALGGLVFLSIMILLAIFVPMVSPYTTPFRRRPTFWGPISWAGISWYA